MKKIVLLLLIAPFFLGCSAKTNPKNILTSFILNVKKFDFQNASSLVTTETKSVLISIKKEFENSTNTDERLIAASKNVTNETVERDYSINTITLVENDSYATLNTGKFQIKFKKTGGEWKLICNQQLIIAIYGESILFDDISKSYSDMLKMYQRKTSLIKNILKNNANLEATNLTKLINEQNQDKSEDINSIFKTIRQYQNIFDTFGQNVNTLNISDDQKIELEGMDNRISLAKMNFNDSLMKYNQKSLFRTLEYLKNKTD